MHGTQPQQAAAPASGYLPERPKPMSSHGAPKSYQPSNYIARPAERLIPEATETRYDFQSGRNEPSQDVEERDSRTAGFQSAEESLSASVAGSPFEQRDGFAASGQTNTFQGVQHARMCRRTVMLYSLSPMTTHEDVTNVVRGGLLLEIYIRKADHVALVSFLREEDATQFYEHARRQDMYIKGKRVGGPIIKILRPGYELTYQFRSWLDGQKDICTLRAILQPKLPTVQLAI